MAKAKRKSPKKKAPTKPPVYPPQKTVLKVFKELERLYPNPKTELVYKNPYELLISVVLSAQTTDAQVNKATPALFQKYPTPDKLGKAKLPDVEKLVHSTGFYKNKAKAIVKCAADLHSRFGGKVPKTIEELTSLAGVGRKTASVVLNQAYDIPAIAVDTHVKRVTNRLGWSFHPNPEKIEFELRALLPESLWSSVNTTLILHGRRVCDAKKPRCTECTLLKDCPFGKEALSQ